MTRSDPNQAWRTVHAEARAARRRRHAGLIAIVTATLALIAPPGLAAEAPDFKGATVTVVNAGKACFFAIVEVFGLLLPREEVSVRPDRPGLKVAEISVDPGETVTAGQPLARLNLPEGGTTLVQAPIAGVVSASSAVIGAVASAKGEPLFSIIARNKFDLVGQVPVRDLSKLAINQTATIKIVGADELTGKVRRVSATVDPPSQLGQVYITVNASKRLLANSSGRAMITTGESCGVSVPLTAVLYGSAGTVVQVVRRQLVETRRVETGLMSGGQIEIREGLAEGDVVVARAGALLREGDPVRPVTATDAKAK
ncbi:efflux RND transporter periplasmic adaptor subunit [Rhodopseudomonas palustris]|uniref:Secretion protein HlyD n=1 Tax=Rhodopseudomonas palustris (strain BisB18) TaxID=316056 RepID=Q20XC9_RHOPB